MKIDKLNSKIADTREKITYHQTKLRELERQKTEQENSEIVELMRSVDVTPRELAAFIEVYRQQGAQAAIESAGAAEHGQEPETDASMDDEE